MNIDRIIKLAIEAKLLHESETKEYISECGVEVWISGQWGLDALEKFAKLIIEDGGHPEWMRQKLADSLEDLNKWSDLVRKGEAEVTSVSFKRVEK